MKPAREVAREWIEARVGERVPVRRVDELSALIEQARAEGRREALAPVLRDLSELADAMEKRGGE